MIKLIVSGLWVCAVTVASCYGALYWTTGRAPEVENDKFFGGLDYVRTKLISVPVISSGSIEGYVVAQFVFTVDSKVLKRLSVKPDVFLVDEAFKVIYAGSAIDFRKPRKQDLPGLSKLIAENVNKRFGSNFVEEVLIEELGYVPKAEARGGIKQ